MIYFQRARGCVQAPKRFVTWLLLCVCVSPARNGGAYPFSGGPPQLVATTHELSRIGVMLCRPFCRLVLLTLATCFNGSLLFASEPKPSHKPNLIIILADDLGYGDLGCFGSKLVKTPVLDKMATEGMTFTDFYSGSTVCAPSRCVLMTGQHTGRCSVRGNSSNPIIQARVDENSYDPVRDYFKERGGKAMGDDHPIAWINTLNDGRFFYTELGHDVRSLETPFGRKHVIEAIRWAARMNPSEE